MSVCKLQVMLSLSTVLMYSPVTYRGRPCQVVILGTGFTHTFECIPWVGQIQASAFLIPAPIRILPTPEEPAPAHHNGKLQAISKGNTRPTAKICRPNGPHGPTKTRTWSTTQRLLHCRRRLRRADLEEAQKIE